MTGSSPRAFRDRERTNPGGFGAPSPSRSPEPQSPPARARRREPIALERFEPRPFELHAPDRRFEWAAASRALPRPAAPRRSPNLQRARWLSALYLGLAGTAAVALLVFGLIWATSEESAPARLRGSALSGLHARPRQPAQVRPPLTIAPPPATATPSLSRAAFNPESSPSRAGATAPARATSEVNPAARDSQPSPFGTWIVPPRD